jgi:L-ascorbate metabolism protein UlaG (beta-lactamase superfamily)
VLGPLGHLGGLIASATRRGAHRRRDLATAAQLAWSDPLPAGLRLTWLGTAGYRLECEGTTLLVDPYVTRLPLGRFLRRQVTRPDPDAIARWIDRADAILIGHTHFDHALDAPAIAAATGCAVYGSRSLAHLMALTGQAARAPATAKPEPPYRDTTRAASAARVVIVEPYRTYAIGPFEVQFVPSRHSRLGLGLTVPMGGELTCEHLDELTPQAYRCGQVWGIHIAVNGVRIYHQGSADLVDDAIRPEHRGVDYFLCGIAGRRFTPRYVERVLARLEPRAVVPSHYDNFFRPLDAPLDFALDANLTGFADEVRAVSADFAIETLSPGGAAPGS